MIAKKTAERIKQSIRISIVTPSYNQAAFIERTICSVIEQNYPDTEHIVIDGGSTDGTQEVLRKYSHRLAYWISEKDNGQTHAINKGLKVATGDLLAYQNSDDVYLPKAFETVAAAYRLHPECGIFSGNINIIDEKDRIIDEIRLIHPYKLLQVYCGPQIHNQAAFWTRETLDRVGYLDESYAFDMDYDFFSKILFAGIRPCQIRQHIGAFRIHVNTKTQNLQHVWRSETQSIINQYRMQMGLLGRLPMEPFRLVGTLWKALVHLCRGEIAYLTRTRYLR